MAGSDNIKYTDFVDEGAFEKIISNAEKMTEAFSKAEVVIKNTMTSLKGGLNKSTKTIADVEQLQESINKTNELGDSLTKVTKVREKMTIDVAKARIEQENYNKLVKESAKDELGLVSLYQKESIALNDLRKQYKDLVLTNNENTASGKLLLHNITQLDAKLKQVDDTVGQHQRHVGNYRGAIKELSKGMSGLAGLLSTVGNAFGINTEHLEHAHEIAKELVKVTKEFTHASKIAQATTELNTIAIEGNTVATEESTVAKEAETVAVESSNAAWLATPLGVFAAVALAIAAVTLAIMEFTKSEEDSAEAIHIFNEAINEQDKNITKLKLSILETQIANDVLTGKITQDTADRLHVQFDAIKQESDAKHAHLNAIAALNKEYQKKEDESLKEQLVKRTKGLIFAGNSVEFYEAERKKKLLIMENKFQTEISLIKTDSATKNIEIANKSIEKNKKVISDAEIDIIDYSKILRDLETQNIKLSYDRRRKEIHDNYDDESKKYAGQTEILKQLAIKRANALEQVDRDQKREYDKILKAQEDEDNKRTMKKIETVDDPKFSPKVALNQEAIKKKSEDDEKARKQEREDAMKHADDLYAIYKEANEKKNKLQLEAIDYSLEQNKSAIEIQLELASRGMDNTLAYEMKKQDELEKARVKELERQKKVAKQQEAVELSLAFIKAYEGYISKGTKSGEALLKASGDIFTAKLLSKAISGSAFEGVEDTGPGGTLDAQGGMLWKLHPHEGVANAKGNKKYKGAIGAINDGTLDSWAMDNIFKPQFNSGMELSDVSKSNQVSNALNMALLGEIRELKEVVKNKPENHSNIDNAGNVIKTMVRNGIKTITVKKTHLS